MIQVPITKLSFPNIRLHPGQTDQLRGYFAGRFGDRSLLFHNHLGADGFRYEYSLIQYKILRNVPTVIGVGEGADHLISVFVDIDELIIGDRKLSVDTKEVDRNNVSVGVNNGLFTYRFLTPYYAFNQKNYKKYRDNSTEHKTLQIDNLLRSHLIAAIVGMGLSNYREHPILAKAQFDPRTVPVQRDNHRMQMFVGSFVTNVELPDFIGIGKSTSAGFGAIARIP